MLCDETFSVQVMLLISCDRQHGLSLQLHQLRSLMKVEQHRMLSKSVKRVFCPNLRQGFESFNYRLHVSCCLACNVWKFWKLMLRKGEGKFHPMICHEEEEGG
jgi:hypothetical protein